MRKIKKTLFLTGLCAVFALGITFPRITGWIQDLNIQQGYEVVDARPLQLAMNSNLSTLEKLSVVKNVTSKVTLETAQKMDEEEAKKVLEDQIKSIVSESDMFSSMGVSFDSYTEKKHVIQLGEYEKKTVIVWNFLLEDETGNQLQILMDDDSGKILGLTYAMAKNPIENQENWGSNRNGTSNGYTQNSEEGSSASRSGKSTAEMQNGTSSVSGLTDSVDIAKAKKKYKKVYGNGILSQYAYDESDVEYIACQLGEAYGEYLGEQIMGISLGGFTASVNEEEYEYLLYLVNSQDDEESMDVLISLTDTRIQINM